jgi:hypothetical protein
MKLEIVGLAVLDDKRSIENYLLPKYIASASYVRHSGPSAFGCHVALHPFNAEFGAERVPIAVVDCIQSGPHTTRFRTAEGCNGAALVWRASAHRQLVDCQLLL